MIKDEIIGNKDRNLVFRTASRINVLVGDKYYEIPYREMGNTVQEPDSSQDASTAAYSTRSVTRSVSAVNNNDDCGFEYINLLEQHNNIILSKKTSNLSVDSGYERPTVYLPIGDEYNGYKVNIYSIKDIIIDGDVINGGSYCTYVYTMTGDNVFKWIKII